MFINEREPVWSFTHMEKGKNCLLTITSVVEDGVSNFISHWSQLRYMKIWQVIYIKVEQMQTQCGTDN